MVTCSPSKLNNNNYEKVIDLKNESIRALALGNANAISKGNLAF